VPPFHITLRALAAAAVFGCAGHIFGRIFVNAVVESLTEHLRRQQEAQKPSAEKDRK